MVVRCRVCGRTVDVAAWSREHEILKKASDDPAFVCDACQEKIRAEAKKDLPT